MATYWIVVYFILLVWARRSLVGTNWIFVYFILLVWARRSLVAVYWIFVFIIARLSRAFSCGHLVNNIARLSQAFSFLIARHLFPSLCSFEPGILLWPFIEYLCISYCSIEPGGQFWSSDYLCICEGNSLSCLGCCTHWGKVTCGNARDILPGLHSSQFFTMSSVLYFICNTLLDDIELLTFKGDIGRGMLYASRDHNVYWYDRYDGSYIGSAAMLQRM